MNNIVIIGGGIAGLSSAETARKNTDGKVTIISKENYLPYNRLKLSKFVYSDFNIQDIYIHKDEWFEQNNIEVRLNSYVKKIDTQKKCILIDNDESIEYTKLIIASGSRGFIPPFNGGDKSGVFVIREAKDVEGIKNYINTNNVKDIAVIGGGLLGIEAAWAFKSSAGTFNINIIENANRILPRQMDEEGSFILEDIIKKNGIGLYKSANVKEIYGDYKVEGVLLEDDKLIKADMVIVSAGIRSNIEMPREAGINVNRGIIVDNFMRTNIDNVFAAGDIAEFNNNVYGIWPVAMEQGKIAGLNAAEKDTQYNEITPSSLLQVMDINVFSTGNISNEDLDTLKIDNGIYSKLFFKNGLIYGGILMGDTKKGFALKRAIEQRKDFTKELSQGDNILQLI